MCCIQTFDFACSHRLPKLILCEVAKNQHKPRRCLNSTKSFKPKTSMILCDDSKRLVDDESDVVVDDRGRVPKDPNSGNDKKMSLLGKILGG